MSIANSSSVGPGWPRVPFAKALRDDTASQPKVLRRDYLDKGVLPVVDQGASAVAGYTDDRSMAYRGTLPVILFGDHTRLVKYVDFPFALGADGVKVLEPTRAYDAKCLYYYLSATDIPQRGYSRHFQFLREIEFPLPPPSEQRRIVEILDQADCLRRLRAEADAKADRILPALFIKVFGDPLSLAKDPRAKPLSSLRVGLQNGFACGEKDVEGGLPHLRMNNIADSGELDLALLRRVPRDFDTERYRLRPGDVLFMSTNSEDKVGKACVFDLDASEAYSFSNHLIRIRIEDPDLEPSYLATFFHSLWRVRYFRGIAKRWVNQSAVSKEALGRVPVVAFPKGLQSAFSAAYERYRSLKAQRAAARDALERMFQTLLRLAFSGELTASWRETHMKQLLQEMEQQAKALTTG